MSGQLTSGVCARCGLSSRSLRKESHTPWRVCPRCFDPAPAPIPRPKPDLSAWVSPPRETRDAKGPVDMDQFTRCLAEDAKRDRR